jgi:hypothetical protein
MGVFTMLRHSQDLRAIVRLSWRGFLMFGATLLASCSGIHSEAHIPVSGISGSDGGAIATIYYDSTGHPHFRN